MQIHQIKSIHQKKKKKRVGRGGKRGTYSGRGLKGQNSRAGRKFQPAIRDLIKKYPKLRGYRFNVLGRTTAIVNLEDLQRKFQANEKVAPIVLFEKKLIRRIKGRVPEVKILGKGELTKKLIIESCQVSKSAKEKIEKANGIVKSKTNKFRLRASKNQNAK